MLVANLLRDDGQSLSSSTQKKLLSLACSLSHGCFENIKIMVEQGAVGALVNILLDTTVKKIYPLAEICCTTIRNLSEENMSVKAFESTNVIKEIITSLQLWGAVSQVGANTNFSFEKLVWGSLANLTTSSKLRTQLCANISLLQLIASNLQQCIPEGGAPLAVDCCRTLGALATDEVNRGRLAKFQIPSLTVALLETYWENSESIAEYAAAAIGDMSLHEINRMQLLSSHACPILIRSLSQHMASGEASRNSCWALASVAGSVNEDIFDTSNIANEKTRKIPYASSPLASSSSSSGSTGGGRGAAAGSSGASGFGFGVDLQDFLATRGACEALVGVLRTHAHDVHRGAVGYAAFTAVVHLALNHRQNQLKFGALGACEILMELLSLRIEEAKEARAQSQHGAEAEAGKGVLLFLRALACLTGNCIETRVRAGATGVCTVLASAMSFFFNDGTIAAAACLAVGSLVR